MAREFFYDEYSIVGQTGGRPHRHRPYQIEKLEKFFQSNQHPTHAERIDLARELGLTENQIKFWFQNRRTLSKAQAERNEGVTLRDQNEKLKSENIEILKLLKSNYCLECRTGDGSQHVLHQLKKENKQLNEEYQNLIKKLLKRGSCSDYYSNRDLLASRMLGNNEITIPSKLQHLAQETNNIEMVNAVIDASAELSTLILADALWIKDPFHEKYSINRKKYEDYMSFLLPTKNKNNHMCNNNNIYGHPLRFESSKEQATVKMAASQLVDMLMNPGMRQDLFPMLITKTVKLLQMNISTGIQLVYEQVHLPTPMVTPRDFYVLRYIDQMTERSWMIVDVSYEYYHHLMDATAANNATGSLQWKLPSGCLIQDLCNGYSKVTWIEHVQVSEKFEYNLYKDLVLGGFAYGAEKWVSELQLMCFRMDRVREGYRHHGREEFEEHMRIMMKITHGMVKNLCESLALKYHVERVRICDSGSRKNDLFITINRRIMGQGEIRSVISIATSIFLPLPPEDVFNFFTDLKLRAKWDVLCAQNASQEIASASYGNDRRNRISVIQPLMSYESNTVILQEAFFDQEIAIMAYTPVNIQSLDLVLGGEDSSVLTFLPSGFIISSANYKRYSNGDGSSTSTSNTKSICYSLVTLTFQALGDPECTDVIDCPFHQIEMERARSLMKSTIVKILGALNIE